MTAAAVLGPYNKKKYTKQRKVKRKSKLRQADKVGGNRSARRLYTVQSGTQKPTSSPPDYIKASERIEKGTVQNKPTLTGPADRKTWTA